VVQDVVGRLFTNSRAIQSCKERKLKELCANKAPELEPSDKNKNSVFKENINEYCRLGTPGEGVLPILMC